MTASPFILFHDHHNFNLCEEEDETKTLNHPHLFSNSAPPMKGDLLKRASGRDSDIGDELRTTKIGSSLKSWSLGYFGSFGKTLWTGWVVFNSSSDNLAPYLSLFFRLFKLL